MRCLCLSGLGPDVLVRVCQILTYALVLPSSLACVYIRTSMTMNWPVHTPSMIGWWLQCHMCKCLYTFIVARDVEERRRRRILHALASQLG